MAARRKYCKVKYFDLPADILYRLSLDCEVRGVDDMASEIGVLPSKIRSAVMRNHVTAETLCMIQEYYKGDE